MTAYTLKPCPQCGGEVSVKEYGEGSAENTGWIIVCAPCNTMMSQDAEGFTKCELDLVEKWNKRAIKPTWDKS